ncbi:MULTISPECIES: FAD-dependent monooxygenase [Mammaliicoccus]|uniref:FAD-dependent monooxygenase n=1 Tax=Mammaliicoccus TaxID=2803850 RepID=UPI000CD00223|nr:MULTISPECIES: FAD-dependent monooxygenase [Mammaliicoccus]HBV03881.1 oxidoreductase [Staphylococcus sp.]MBW0766643.1 NAD(P)-binding protein [Mammaliicoccus lentus]MDQ7141697.1 FAD-dependent monooxygenase [Mammaliicoccus lentus]POA05526.1 oxidoreductase [Mammaliicoccus lentus]SUM52803.1 monooxygenase [Mammaliicoccus lentus]
MKELKILVSGASIAGLTSAYWLNKKGFEVTIVEKASKIRGGGYPIDVRGSAINIVKMMGIYDELKAQNLNNMKFKILDNDNSVISQFTDATMKANEDIEIPRGDLTTALYKCVEENDINLIFNDSIKTMNHLDDGVEIELESGKQGSYDLVVGADGIHSNTRKLTFGEESQFTNYLGHCFTGFTVENYLDMYKEGMIYSEPGRTAIMYATKNKESVHAFLIFSDEEEPSVNHRDIEGHKKLVKDKFKDVGGIASNLLETLEQTEDIYFDTTTQIIMDQWAENRAVLVGDAAHAPSFLTGQGSSLAMIGAYILADELEKNNSIKDAFIAYEKYMKPFAEINQNAVENDGSSILYPKNNEEIEKRNAILKQIENITEENMGSQDLIDITRVIDYPKLND